MSKNKKIIKSSSVILSALILTSGLAPSVSAASEAPKKKQHKTFLMFNFNHKMQSTLFNNIFI